MPRSNHTHHFWHAFDPIASALFTFRDHGAARTIALKRSMCVCCAAPNLIQRHGRGLTAKITKLSAYEHGQNAATGRKHLQACPFDSGTMEWRQWRDGFLSVTRPE